MRTRLAGIAYDVVPHRFRWPRDPDGKMVRMGDHELHNPVLKALVVVLTVPVVFAVIAFVLLAVGAVVSLTLGGVGLLLVVLALGLPLLIVAAVVLKVLSIPFRGFSRRLRR